MVHRSPYNSSDMAVVSVLFNASLDYLDEFMYNLNPNISTINQPRPVIPFSSQLFDKLYGNFYYYNGSMTFPPCSENVRWFVFNQFVPMTTFFDAQLYNLLGSPIYGGNYRTLQPLNGRSLELVSKIYWSQYQYMRAYNNPQSSMGLEQNAVRVGIFLILLISIVM